MYFQLLLHVIISIGLRVNSYDYFDQDFILHYC